MGRLTGKRLKSVKLKSSEGRVTQIPQTQNDMPSMYLLLLLLLLLEERKPVATGEAQRNPWSANRSVPSSGGATESFARFGTTISLSEAFRGIRAPLRGTIQLKRGAQNATAGSIARASRFA